MAVYVFVTRASYTYPQLLGLKDYMISAIHKRDRVLLDELIKGMGLRVKKSSPNDLPSYWWRVDGDISQHVGLVTM